MILYTLFELNKIPVEIWRKKMFFRILKKDLKRKKTMNLILLVFIILAAMFLASSMNNLIAINGAVDHFMEISKVPDFFVVTLSDGKNDAVDEYLQKDNYLSKYEIINTFDISNDQISIEESTQNADGRKYERNGILYLGTVPDNFLKVFCSDGSELHLKSGEIALNKLEAESNQLEMGDKIKIKIGEVEQEFTVVSVLKDAVFGNEMIGTKRHVICQEDFEKYQEQENLIYSRIYCVNYKDGNKKAFMNHWKRQGFSLVVGVEKEAVKTCYVMDMLVAGVFIVVSVCLILIAFLVLRFTIVFTLQEDYKEIGIMKAIGMRDMGIKGIYLVKYLMISIVGAGLGFCCSFPFGNILLKQAIVNIVVEKADQNIAVNIVCSVMIIFIILLFCYGSTNKLRKFSAMDAIRNGSDGERYQIKNRLKLWKRNRMKPYFYMAANDILSGFKRFFILAATFCIGTMLILLPLSAVSTLKSDSIISMFSYSPSDVYMDNGKLNSYVQQENIDMLLRDMDRIEDKLAVHGLTGKTGADVIYVIPCYAENPEDIYTYNIFQAIGSWDRHYTLLEGREPELENELIITDITAKEMGVSIGDSIFFREKDGEKEYIITGTYQSMINMGKGFRVSRSAVMDYGYASLLFCIQVEIDGMESKEACERLKEIFPDDRIWMANEFIDSMIGGIAEQMDTMIVFIVGIVLVINSLITVLMMKTIMTKERGDIALLKSIGFKNSVVRKWQSVRIILVLAVSIVVGTILSNLLAPVIIVPIFAMMGGNKIELVMNPLDAYVIYPLLLLAVTGVAAFLCAGAVRKVDLKEVNNME